MVEAQADAEEVAVALAEASSGRGRGSGTDSTRVREGQRTVTQPHLRPRWLGYRLIIQLAGIRPTHVDMHTFPKKKFTVKASRTKYATVNSAVLCHPPASWHLVIGPQLASAVLSIRSDRLASARPHSVPFSCGRSPAFSCVGLLAERDCFPEGRKMPC